LFTEKCKECLSAELDRQTSKPYNENSTGKQAF